MLNSTELEQLFPTNSPEYGTGANAPAFGEAAELEGRVLGKNEEMLGGDPTYGRTAGEAEIVGMSVELREFKLRKKIKIDTTAESLVMGAMEGRQWEAQVMDKYSDEGGGREGMGER